MICSCPRGDSGAIFVNISLRLQLVAIAPSLEKTGEVSKVTAYTSDLIELVSGVSPVSTHPLSTRTFIVLAYCTDAL